MRKEGKKGEKEIVIEQNLLRRRHQKVTTHF